MLASDLHLPRVDDDGVRAGSEREPNLRATTRTADVVRRDERLDREVAVRDGGAERDGGDQRAVDIHVVALRQSRKHGNRLRMAVVLVVLVVVVVVGVVVVVVVGMRMLSARGVRGTASVGQS
jgi:hypothetical protein